MHFVGKFFKTLGILITQPGFLSVEYKKGMRADYVHPAIMYFIIAPLFFWVFYSGFRDQKVYFGAVNGKKIVRNGTLELLKQGYKKAKTKEDSLEIAKAIRELQDSTEIDNDEEDENEKGTGSGLFNLYDTTYKSAAAYDSVQRSLPPDKRDGWLEKIGTRRDVVLSERYRKNGEYVWVDIVNKFIQYYPYMIFLLLPLFAVFLKLLYVRRKQFYFTDHCLFLTHLNTLLFFVMLLYLVVLSLKKFSTESRLALTAFAILIFEAVYTIIAMKRFYEQGLAKTILKFILFSILCIISLFSAFAVIYSISISWS